MPSNRIHHPYFSQPHESWVIPLTRGVICLVDEDVAEVLGQFYWCAQPKRDTCWYAIRNADGGDGRHRSIRMHREIMGAPATMQVDHREHHPFEAKIIDNRRTNLRICTGGENACNLRRAKNGKSPFKGVSWFAQHEKWRADIRKSNRLHFLGLFVDPLEAAYAYDRAAIEMHGEFAATNASLGLLSNPRPGTCCPGSSRPVWR
jgi:hypothetical protein